MNSLALHRFYSADHFRKNPWEREEQKQIEDRYGTCFINLWSWKKRYDRLSNKRDDAEQHSGNIAQKRRVHADGTLIVVSDHSNSEQHFAKRLTVQTLKQDEINGISEG